MAANLVDDNGHFFYVGGVECCRYQGDLQAVELGHEGPDADIKRRQAKTEKGTQLTLRKKSIFLYGRKGELLGTMYKLE